MTTARLVLFAGQSNMFGHYKATDGDKPTHPNVFAWDNKGEDGHWHSAELGRAPFNPSEGAPNNAACHFGVGLAELFNQQIFLVGCPVSGSSILSWSAADASNMARLLEQVSCALKSQELQSAGVDFVDTMLWHQGETDDPGATMVKETRVMCLADYKAAFDSMIHVLRAQPWWHDTTRFIAGELVRNGWLAARNDFYQDSSLWPADLAMAVVSSEGLADIGDRAHLTGLALQQMGVRMVQARRNFEAKGR